jgi:hypothetical protein
MEQGAEGRKDERTVIHPAFKPSPAIRPRLRRRRWSRHIRNSNSPILHTIRLRFLLCRPISRRIDQFLKKPSHRRDREQQYPNLDGEMQRDAPRIAGRAHVLLVEEVGAVELRAA